MTPGRFAKPRTRRVRIAQAVFVVLLLISLLLVFAVQRQLNPPGPPGAAVSLTIPPGATTSQIADLLEDQGVVGRASFFSAYTRVKGEGSFQAGKYTFRKRQSFADVVRTLKGGPEITVVALTVPEGLKIDQIADRAGKLEGIESEAFLAIASSGELRSKYQPADVASLEGLLFPETYNVEEDDTERQLVSRMLAEFDATVAELEIEAAAERLGLTEYELVIIASLVEREAKLPEDFPKVAGVIHNRLEIGMPLQIDATLLYAQGQHKNRVLNRDKEVDSPYNTYENSGLPPTPIASPGRRALDAALNPAQHDLLYYVTINDCTGETAFAKTYAEHNRNIARRRAENPDDCGE